jgi:hypothetical protein
MPKNLTFQTLHFNQKLNKMNSILSYLTFTIPSLLFKQLYFLSPPFPFQFLSPFFSFCRTAALCFFSSPLSASSSKTAECKAARMSNAVWVSSGGKVPANLGISGRPTETTVVSPLPFRFVGGNNGRPTETTAGIISVIG